MSSTKTCTRCGSLKLLTAFPVDRDRRRKNPGYKSQCKSCANERAKKWQAENYERAFASQHRWRSENRERFNAHMSVAGRVYRSKRQRQTPAWADHAKIAEVYAIAEAMRQDGHVVEVDHIVPLQGRTASGLHVHWNLQIIEKRENQRKRNVVNPNAHAAPHALELFGD